MRSGIFAVLIVGVLWACLATPSPGRADVVDGYCCFCANCTTGNAFQCSDVLAKGLATAAAATCPDACAALGCQFSTASEGACALVAACPEHTRAPALSPVVLGMLMVGLGGWGVYRVERVRQLSGAK